MSKGIYIYITYMDDNVITVITVNHPTSSDTTLFKMYEKISTSLTNI